MNVLCLDLEGVLIPEIWQELAQCAGIDALNKTTRDIPDYNALMQFRLGVLRRHDLRFSMIQQVVRAMTPLPGAQGFLHQARQRSQVVVVSDTFYEFTQPLMAKLGWPTLLCHHLDVQDDRISSYRLRQHDPKRCAVQAFKSLNFPVAAAGDSYNDIPMLEEADLGVLFRAPAKVRKEHPQYAAVDSYEALLGVLESQGM